MKLSLYRIQIAVSCRTNTGFKARKPAANPGSIISLPFKPQRPSHKMGTGHTVRGLVNCWQQINETVTFSILVQLNWTNTILPEKSKKMRMFYLQVCSVMSDSLLQLLCPQTGGLKITRFFKICYVWTLKINSDFC